MKFWRKSWHKKALDSTQKLWEEKYENVDIQQPLQETSSTTKEPTEFDLIARELDLTSSRSCNSSHDDFMDFVSRSPTPLPPNTTALEWWLREEQQHAYPRLSKMAIDILSIPAMSAEPERIFSGSRRTIS